MLEVEELRSVVRIIQAQIDCTAIGREDALQYWFERLDDAKRELLMFGKLKVVSDEN